MNEQISALEIDARMSAMAQQREQFANQVVIMAGTIAALQNQLALLRKQLDELTAKPK